jgi:hypothetical protein
MTVGPDGLMIGRKARARQAKVDAGFVARRAALCMAAPTLNFYVPAA